jgi:hypothetical protein
MKSSTYDLIVGAFFIFKKNLARSTLLANSENEKISELAGIVLAERYNIAVVHRNPPRGLHSPIARRRCFEPFALSSSSFGT